MTGTEDREPSPAPAGEPSSTGAPAQGTAGPAQRGSRSPRAAAMGLAILAILLCALMSNAAAPAVPPGSPAPRVRRSVGRCTSQLLGRARKRPTARRLMCTGFPSPTSSAPNFRSGSPKASSAPTMMLTGSFSPPTGIFGVRQGRWGAQGEPANRCVFDDQADGAQDRVVRNCLLRTDRWTCRRVRQRG